MSKQIPIGTIVRFKDSWLESIGATPPNGHDYSFATVIGYAGKAAVVRWKFDNSISQVSNPHNLTTRQKGKYTPTWKK